MLRQHAFLHRPGVRRSPRLKRLWKSLPRLRNQRIQFLPQHFVIVAAPCVTRNPSPRRFFFRTLARNFCRIFFRRVVIHRADDHAAHPAHRRPHIRASRVVQILHLTRVPASRACSQVQETPVPPPRRTSRIQATAPSPQSTPCPPPIFLCQPFSIF